MDQLTGSKLGKGYDKAEYCQLGYLTSIQRTSCDGLDEQHPGWMTHKVESRLPGEVSTTSDMQMIPL